MRPISVAPLLVFGACAIAPQPAPPARGVDDGQVDLVVRFEPALAMPGVLIVEHEAGVRLELPTGRTGVELRLPPGPASLQLRVGDRSLELPIRVRGAETIPFSTAEIAPPRR